MATEILSSFLLLVYLLNTGKANDLQSPHLGKLIENDKQARVSISSERSLRESSKLNTTLHQIIENNNVGYSPQKSDQPAIDIDHSSVLFSPGQSQEETIKLNTTVNKLPANYVPGKSRQISRKLIRDVNARTDSFPTQSPGESDKQFTAVNRTTVSNPPGQSPQESDSPITDVDHTVTNFTPGPSTTKLEMSVNTPPENYTPEQSLQKSSESTTQKEDTTTIFSVEKSLKNQKSSEPVTDVDQTTENVSLRKEESDEMLRVTEQVTRNYPSEQSQQKSEHLITDIEQTTSFLPEELPRNTEDCSSEQKLGKVVSYIDHSTVSFPFAISPQQSDMVLRILDLETGHVPAVLSAQAPVNLIKDIRLAYRFAQNYDTILSHLMNTVTLASWNYNVNMTDKNKENEDKASYFLNEFLMKQKKRAEDFAWKEFQTQDPVLHRWFKLLIKPPQNEKNLKMVHCKVMSHSGPKEDMKTIHSSAKICPYKSNGPCNLELEPDLNQILENSKDFDELAYIWAAYRNATGRRIRPLFIRDIEPINAAARSAGFADMGHKYRSGYESDTFLEDVARYAEEIRPLFEHLHAFIRRRLMKYYPIIKADGPIPLNVVGDMNGLKWHSLYKMVNPFTVESPNVTSSMLKLKLKPIDLFKIAEKFYVSLGMREMTPKFWKNSVFEKRNDAKMVCHASAWDLGTGDDYRVKMCTEVNGKYLNTVSHEMGHIQYFMSYANLTRGFRDSANPGFTEAIGEVAVLSSSTPSYLEQIGLLKETYEHSKEKDLAYLLHMALIYLPTLPGTYIVDLWRYGVFKREIKTNELNRKWWEMRLKYQGVCPPFERTEEDFDIGARYHISHHVEYMRYFIANIFQFQLYESLCKEAELQGPLFKCNLYGSKKAGALFSKFLSSGKMKPWPELLRMLSKNATSSIETGPLIHYFAPLFEWLKKENEGYFVGWKSDNPMKCP